ncbi:MAG TPA: hypothetical protein VFN68_11010 [Acidimicrobiales bacterium]|nr:hypothetical protein [Acidimicrobiales bacterium]
MAGPIGAYPGTFDPPTVAHLAVAEAARRQAGLSRVDLVVSRRPLGKAPEVPSFEDRLAVLSAVAAGRPWLGIEVSDGRLIADVCRGYDTVIMGLDKWHQVTDPAWYGDSEAARDAAVASLPPVLLALRAGSPPPSSLTPTTRVLQVGDEHLEVSSTMARAGRREWMLPEAARFDIDTGAWSDPERYLRARHAGTSTAGTASLSPMPAATDSSEE